MPGKSNPLTDLLFSIVIPSLVLLKFSDDKDLGAVGALVVALTFPLVLGCYQLVRLKLTNYVALLGLISVLLTGGIGLLKLDVGWLAIKEAAIPALIGSIVLISARMRYPLIKKLIFQPAVLNTEEISRILVQRGNDKIFETRLLQADYMLSGTFFFSVIMNYILTKWIVSSPSGSVAFNEELGRLTLISYPAIAVPSLLMMLVIVLYLWRVTSQLTGLKLEGIVAMQSTDNK